MYKRQDDSGASLVAWDKDSNGYIITTEYYTVSYNANGGNVDVTSQLVNVDASYTNPVPTRVGYTFLGWYSADGTKYTDGIWTTTSDVVLTAKWVANTDTAYVVNHYQQNIEDDEYTLFEQENLTGTSDVKVTPTVKKYVGFTSPDAKNVTIVPDGSLVVNYYYKRNYYTIKVVGNGGSDYSVRLKYDTPIDPMSWTSRDGYTLGGYYSDLSMTEPYTNTKVGAQNITIYAFWIGDAYYSDFTYTSSTSGVTITGYTGASPIVKVPEQINGQTVVSIAPSAFENNTNIRSINIPDTVENIAKGAFKGCSSLESMTIPFVGISKTASNSSQLLFGCIFGTSSYNGGVATEQYYASQKEYRTTHYIPSSLKSVTVTGGKLSYGAFYNCTNLSNVTIGSGVTSIGSDAFYNCSGLTSITIPDSVTSIGYEAFSGCTKLTSVTIPDSVTSIGDYAFDGCYRLIEVYNKSALPITAGSSSNGYVAYYAKNVYKNEGGSKLATDENGYVIYTDGDEKILVAYHGTETELTLPTDITQINQAAFSGCSKLTSITIPDSVTSIGNYAFKGCNSLTSITIPNSVTSIGSYVFSWCSRLTSITIPDSVTSIYEYAFEWCSSLTSVTIGSGVTSIGERAFWGCKGLTSVTIPDSVTDIGYCAFYGCERLTSVTYKGTEKQWRAIRKGEMWKYDVPSSCKVYCTDGTVFI